MARQTRDTALETRAARGRLAACPKPYWRTLEAGLHLGYRKPRRGSGAWLLRIRTDAGAYREAGIGCADDFDDADGEIVLSYSQAQTKARATRITAERAARGLDTETRRGPYTVADAMADYEADFIRRGKKALATIRTAANTHILPALGTVALDQLTKERLSRWHADLATAPKMVRTGKGQERQSRAHVTSDADAVRRRRSSANRIFTTLKAALNLAFADGKVSSDEPWRRVKPFRAVDSSRVRALTEAESVRLLDAADTSFRPLARAALLTGCRYGELIRLRADEVDLRGSTIFVAESKSGKSRRVPLNNEGAAFFFDQTRNIAGNDLVFTRTSFHRPGNGQPNQPIVRGWKTAEPDRFMARASARAQIKPPVSFHELRHTYASILVSAGVPIAFVAEVLGHSDTRITSKHYSHLAPSSVATAIRQSLPSFASKKPALQV